MMYPENLKYSKEHEWVMAEAGNRARIGITFFAQKELGDVVFVELPEEGAEVAAGDGFAVVESVKAVSDIYAPVSGRVVEVNQALNDNPERINEDPYGEGWIAVIEMTDAAELDDLLNSDDYAALVAEA
ncbi:MAG TPA: glycine cleavage system protein GcvH [Firmicutes bacterium]|nr:glycine cleavage system protein GcvH [Bacillota bacterium]